MNQLIWTKKASKQLRKIASQDRKIIYAKAQALTTFPDTAHVKQLSNHPYTYRLRVGRYRVFFEHDSTVKIIHIEEVKKRDERTY